MPDKRIKELLSGMKNKENKRVLEVEKITEEIERVKGDIARLKAIKKNEKRRTVTGINRSIYGKETDIDKNNLTAGETQKIIDKEYEKIEKKYAPQIEELNRKLEEAKRKDEEAKKRYEEEKLNEYKKISSEIKNYHLDMHLEVVKRQKELDRINEERKFRIQQINNAIKEKEREIKYISNLNAYSTYSETEVNNNKIRDLNTEIESLKSEKNTIQNEYSIKIKEKKEELRYYSEKKGKAELFLSKIRLSEKSVDEICGILGIALDAELNQTTEQPANQTTEQPVNQTTEQPVNQTTEQPVNQTTEQPVNQTTEQPVNQTPEQPVNQTTEQPANQTTEQPANQTTEQPANQTTEQPVNETTEQPVNQTPEQPVNETTEQPVNQTTEQPANQTTEQPAAKGNSEEQSIDELAKEIVETFGDELGEKCETEGGFRANMTFCFVKYGMKENVNRIEEEYTKCSNKAELFQKVKELYEKNRETSNLENVTLEDVEPEKESETQPETAEQEEVVVDGEKGKLRTIISITKAGVELKLVDERGKLVGEPIIGKLGDNNITAQDAMLDKKNGDLIGGLINKGGDYHVLKVFLQAIHEGRLKEDEVIEQLKDYVALLKGEKNKEEVQFDLKYDLKGILGNKNISKEQKQYIIQNAKEAKEKGIADVPDPGLAVKTIWMWNDLKKGFKDMTKKWKFWNKNEALGEAPREEKQTAVRNGTLNRYSDLSLSEQAEILRQTANVAENHRSTQEQPIESKVVTQNYSDLPLDIQAQLMHQGEENIK